MLITFEGIDGAGKSTHARLFMRHLKERRLDHLLLREPTDGEWGRKIRSLLEEHDTDLSPKEAFRLFTLDRKENVKENIAPALKSGKIVVLDRYYLSSIAYQGALGIDPELIRSANESFAPKPDLVFLLDIDPSTGLRRIAEGRNEKATLYEKAGYLKKVKDIFDSMKDPSIRRVDASLPLQQAHEKIIEEFGKAQ